jgi:cyanophycinase
MQIRLDPMKPLVCLLTAAAGVWAQPGGDASPFGVPGVRTWLTGSAADIEKPVQGGMALMGGGAHVEEAFRWFLERAGGGDALVLRSGGGDDYNQRLAKLGAADSVESLSLTERVAAGDAAVIERIRSAEAIWVAEGNPYDYVRLWKDTALEHQLLLAAKRNVLIGGAGAGASVLGQYVFSAEEGDAASPETLANPFLPKIKLARQFFELSLLDNVLVDAHFKQKDRMGRMIVFLARILQYGWERSTKGIGVDENTALLVDDKGKATVVGDGSVYFVRTVRKADVCEPSVPLSMRGGVTVYRIGKGGSFDIEGWDGSGGVEYKIAVERGKLLSTQPGGAIY